MWHQLTETYKQAPHPGLPAMLCGADFVHWHAPKSLLVTWHHDLSPFAVASQGALRLVECAFPPQPALVLLDQLTAEEQWYSTAATPKLARTCFDRADYVLTWSEEAGGSKEATPARVVFMRYDLCFERTRRADGRDALAWSADAQLESLR